MISCFSNYIPEKYLTCLFKSEQYQLAVIIFNQYLEKVGNEVLHLVKNSTENENMFFKGITFKENTSIIAYYTDYQNNYLRISLKKLVLDEYNSPMLTNYSYNTTLLI